MGGRNISSCAEAALVNRHGMKEPLPREEKETEKVSGGGGDANTSH